MNPLLVKPPRRVELVKGLSRQELTIYVRALTGAEFLDMGQVLGKTSNAKDSTAAQFEFGVCNAAAEPLLAQGEGVLFVEAISPNDVKLIMKAFDALNAVTNETVEEELKN